MSQLRTDVEIAHPPALVWRALTEAKPLNEWFQPVAGWPESGARPGSQGRISPTDDLRGFGSFDMDVVEADPYSRLVMRWRGNDFNSKITFEIKPVPGGASRLLVSQTGFLGTAEAERRETLGRAREVMLERLRATVGRMALGLGEGAFLAAGSPAPAKRQVKAHHRVRFVAIAGAAILAGLFGTAGAVWMSRDVPPVSAPADDGVGGPSLGIGVQPMASNSPAKSPAVRGTKEESPPAAPTTASAGKPLAANYRIRALPVGLLGFDTDVTVTNPGGAAKAGWTVVLTMPDATAVENRSAQTVKIRQEGATVTVTPVTATLPAGASVSFTIRFPALLALDPSITGCTIDGNACTAS